MSVIKTYDINKDYLPRKVLVKSMLSVLVCALLLSSILLLLPIQDTIKGDVIIYVSGQPLKVRADNAGVYNSYIHDNDIVDKDQLIATIDVDVSQGDLDLLHRFVQDQLSDIDWRQTDKLLTSIRELVTRDFREINPNLYGLSDIIQQLEILDESSRPGEVIASLDKALGVKYNQLSHYASLKDNQTDILKLLQDQLRLDSILYQQDGISKRAYLDRRQALMEQHSKILESDVLSSGIQGEVAEVEQVKAQLNQDYRTKTEELKLRAIDQIGAIRLAYRQYLDDYIITAPISGKVSVLDEVDDQDQVESGTVLLYITPRQKQNRSSSELYVAADNAGKIEPGMKVRIGLNEFDQKEFGIYYTEVRSISEVPVEGRYRIDLELDLPIKTSYNISLPTRQTYNGDGEILLGKINLLTKISREIKYNRDKYASL